MDEAPLGCVKVGCGWPLGADGSMRTAAAGLAAALSPRVRMRTEPFSFQVAAGALGFCGLGTCSSIWSKAQLSSTPPESLPSSEAAISAQLEDEESGMVAVR